MATQTYNVNDILSVYDLTNYQTPWKVIGFTKSGNMRMQEVDMVKINEDNSAVDSFTTYRVGTTLIGDVKVFRWSANRNSWINKDDRVSGLCDTTKTITHSRYY